MQKYRKQHFQLLEIMVALLLIVGCAVPAMHIYFNMYKKQDAMARAYEIDHLAHLFHAKIVERLYRHEISFDEFNGSELSFEDQEISSELTRLGYTNSFTLTLNEPHKGTPELGGVKRLAELKIKMTDERDHQEKIYDYKLFIAGGPKPEKWNDEPTGGVEKIDNVNKPMPIEEKMKNSALKQKMQAAPS